MAKRKKKPDPIQIETPLPEQEAKGDFRRIGMHYRRVPVIETLYAEHKLTSRQFNGLARYRDVAVAEERSPIEDSVGKLLRNCVGGGDDGLGSDINRERALMVFALCVSNAIERHANRIIAMMGPVGRA